MIGCCSGGAAVGSFQTVQVRKNFPFLDRPITASDIDGWWAETDALLTAEPFPGVYSSRTFVTIDADGSVTRSFAQITQGQYNPVQSLFSAPFDYTTPPQPPRIQDAVFFNGGAASVQKVRVILQAPWGSFLDRTADQAYGTINDCFRQGGNAIHEVEFSMAGKGSTSLCFIAWHAPFGYGTGIRNGQIASGIAC